jgi:hypothetical protein
MTLSDVAELTLLSWDTVKAITKTHLAKDYGKPALQGVRYLGIDEIHLGKKKRFYTIVIDLEDGRILWAKPGRGKAALRGFWRRLRLGGSAALALVEQAGEDVLGKQADVFGEHGDDALQDEAAGADAVFATEDEGVEGIGDVFGRFAGDVDPVMAEEGLEGAREQEIQRGVAGGQIGEGDTVNRLLELGVEVVNPKLVEVAEHDVGRAVGDEVEPVVEGLLVVFGEFDAAGLHFDEAAARPDEVGELSTLAREVDAVFEGGTLRQGVGVVAEGRKQVKEEGLGFALFVALELGSKLGEIPQTFFQ